MKSKDCYVQPRCLLSIKATNYTQCATTHEILLTYQRLSFSQSKSDRKNFSKMTGGQYLIYLAEVRLKQICGLD